MAITKSSACMVLMPPAPGLFQMVLKPCALALPKNCQVSHSSDATTSGKPKRPINLRTSATMLPDISATKIAPSASVAANGNHPAAKPDCLAIAAAPSRMMTSSNVVQPTSCTMFSSTGSLAKLEP